MKDDAGLPSSLTQTMLSILVRSASERRLQTRTPADTVLTHFRIVRYVLLIPMSQAIDLCSQCTLPLVTTPDCGVLP